MGCSEQVNYKELNLSQVSLQIPQNQYGKAFEFNNNNSTLNLNKNLHVRVCLKVCLITSFK